MAKGSQGSKGGGKGTGHTQASGDKNSPGTGGHRKSADNDHENTHGDGSDHRGSGGEQGGDARKHDSNQSGSDSNAS